MSKEQDDDFSVMAAKEKLSIWFALANLCDSYGLPADLIWCRLRDGHHPIADECTSEEFEKHINMVVQLRQGAGRHKAGFPTGLTGEILKLSEEMMAVKF